MREQAARPSASTCRPLRRWGVVAATASSSLLTMIGFVVTSVAIHPAMAGASTACASRQALSVSYTVATTKAPASPTANTVVTAVVIRNLNAGCDTLTANLLLEGNTAGNPATTAQVLSSATSKLNPCTGAKLSSPPTVKTGAITLDLCSTSKARARYVAVHDLTRITLTIGGTVIVTTATAGSTSTNSSSSAGSNNTGGSNIPVSTVTASTSSLAFTGAEITAMVASGISLVVGGLLFLRLSRRRRSPSAGSDPPQG